MSAPTTNESRLVCDHSGGRQVVDWIRGEIVVRYEYDPHDGINGPVKGTDGARG